MNKNKPVDNYYYSESEWARLGCGPLPAERDRNRLKDFTAEQKADIIAKSNPKIDNNVIKGYN